MDAAFVGLYGAGKNVYINNGNNKRERLEFLQSTRLESAVSVPLAHLRVWAGRLQLCRCAHCFHQHGIEVGIHGVGNVARGVGDPLRQIASGASVGIVSCCCSSGLRMDLGLAEGELA